MRIAIIEDDLMLCESLKIIINNEKEMEVVGTYQTAEAALEGLEITVADMVIVDLGLPGMSGLEFIRKAEEKGVSFEMLVHTVYEDKKNVFSAIKAGALGYIVKGGQSGEIIDGLRSLGKGGAPMSPSIARAVIHDFQDSKIDKSGYYLLTAREKEVLKLLEHGLSYKECAESLYISPHTIHAHIKNIYEKLQAKNRQQALLKAREIGIL